MPKITTDDLVLPAELLAYKLLPLLPDRPFRRSSLVFSFLPPAPATPGMVQQRTLSPADPFAMEIAEALAHLEAGGLLVQWPPQDPQYTSSGQGDMLAVTRLGRAAQAKGASAGSWMRARRRLGVDLHVELAARLQTSIVVGAFEQAALIALRAIEARVRALAGDPVDGRGNRLTGVPLMRKAFGDGGPLADPGAEPGERTGTMELFAGAFGAVRNLLAHTEVEWSDSVEAAEYVLLADLLMRILDRAEARASTTTP